jgi:5-methylcytosine-specific restriction endonuclease McrA
MIQLFSIGGIDTAVGRTFGPKGGFVGWREEYERHLESDYWRQVRRAVRRRAKGSDGVVRCQRCGTEEGPFDVHHTTEAYAHLGEELEHLDLMRYWCRGCHEHRHGRGPDPMIPASWEELERRVRQLSG